MRSGGLLIGAENFRSSQRSEDKLHTFAPPCKIHDMFLWETCHRKRLWLPDVTMAMVAMVALGYVTNALKFMLEHKEARLCSAEHRH